MENCTPKNLMKVLNNIEKLNLRQEIYELSERLTKEQLLNIKKAIEEMI